MIKMKKINYALFLLLFANNLFAQAPWKFHGSLEVASNGHYITHQDGTPFLWIGDTGWGLFQQLNREEVDKYLDHRQKTGFNVIQSVAFWYPHGGGIDSGPHNAANAYGHRPFTGGEDSPNTSEPLIVAGGSPSAPNDYWDHADYIIQGIKKRNMYIALLPNWGRSYITTQFGGTHSEFNIQEAKEYGAFLGKRYKNEPHILWVLGGDAKGISTDSEKNFDSRAIFRAMAEGIVQGVTNQSPKWNEADPAWKKVFITYHPDGDADKNSSNWFHEDKWLTANGVEVWKEVEEVYPSMLREYNLDHPKKPSLFLEGSYEFSAYGHDCGWVSPVRIRRQVYHTFFAGGAGHTYGAGPIWPMRGNKGNYSCGYTWQQALDFPGAFQFAQLAKNFLVSHQWAEWVPDQSILQGTASEGESLRAAVKLGNSEMLLVYFSNNSNGTVKNTLTKPAEAKWFDPSEGRETKADAFEPDEQREIKPPSGWEDAILVLTAKK
ncbi:apiosidase-like domain-containing protein [Cyclobacterium qasimii]|uniref:DUF4038 domain-containing protein n=2 Tax=Cyclobacterium qasimii TaxID=1350429 RepID=S7X6X7_9BACT|nr:DUF4038 domain-containing protein [Cyclobacterium qasimii]EPR71813.1 hypothetical protein ADICYQ_0061 [Cyclobacterium qasimii M12-11B]GEO22140.1 hypothetical protein CQA01_26740 [Cyclobacterium qasimii]